MSCTRPVWSSKISNGPNAPDSAARFTANALVSRLPEAIRFEPSKAVKDREVKVAIMVPLMQPMALFYPGKKIDVNEPVKNVLSYE
jgi:hypothetical protein